MEFNRKRYEKYMMDHLISLVNIPSVLDETSPIKPFGKGIHDALNQMMIICEEMGFNVYQDQDGYYGYAEVGDGKELVGILGHLDVVPVVDLESWNTPPFKGTILDGKLYGRGTQDNKGPMISVMYATKALLDMGIKFNKRVRFIFGTDEENMWRSINKYIEQEEIPKYSFTPDAVFPLIYSEKDLIQLYVKGEGIRDYDIQSGQALNSVPDQATLTYSNLNLVEHKLIELKLKEKNYTYTAKEGFIKVDGKSAHAAKPDEGINAGLRLIECMNSVINKSPLTRFITDVFFNGQNKFIPEYEDKTGKTTVNVGKININEKEEVLGLDIRMPVALSKEEIIRVLNKKAAEYGLTCELYDYLAGFIMDENHELIRILRQSYEEVTGLDSTPLSTGGATYARALNNCVAFGAMLPYGEKTEHQANEYLCIEDLFVATDIYMNALLKLIK